MATQLYTQHDGVWHHNPAHGMYDGAGLSTSVQGLVNDAKSFANIVLGTATASTGSTTADASTSASFTERFVSATPTPAAATVVHHHHHAAAAPAYIPMPMGGGGGTTIINNVGGGTTGGTSAAAIHAQGDVDEAAAEREREERDASRRLMAGVVAGAAMLGLAYLVGTNVDQGENYAEQLENVKTLRNSVLAPLINDQNASDNSTHFATVKKITDLWESTAKSYVNSIWWTTASNIALFASATLVLAGAFAGSNALAVTGAFCATVSLCGKLYMWGRSGSAQTRAENDARQINTLAASLDSPLTPYSRIVDASVVPSRFTGTASVPTAPPLPAEVVVTVRTSGGGARIETRETERYNDGSPFVDNQEPI